MRISMLLPERKTPVKETISDIQYGKFQFDNPRREFWLPKEIDVSWEFPQVDGGKLGYRNFHKYSDYRFFTVDTDYKIAQPKANEYRRIG